jgi:hypothetical protein
VNIPNWVVIYPMNFKKNQKERRQKMRMRESSACVYLLLIYISSVNSLTFNVDPSKEECLYDDINIGVRVSGSFQVIRIAEASKSKQPSLTSFVSPRFPLADFSI